MIYNDKGFFPTIAEEIFTEWQQFSSIFPLNNMQNSLY